MSVDVFREQVGLAAAARWAAQQPSYAVQTRSPALRHAILRAAIRQAALPQPGQPNNRYTSRRWLIEQSCPQSPMDDRYWTVLVWSIHFGFALQGRSTSLYCRDHSRSATPAEVYQAIADIHSALRREAEKVARAAAALASIDTGEYNRLRDLYHSAVETAYEWYGVNYYLASDRS